MSATAPGGPSRGETTPGRGTRVAVDVSPPAGTRRRFVVLLAGPFIWTLHFLVVYLVVEAGCSGEGRGLGMLEPPVPTVVTLVATTVAAVACLTAAAWGFRWWREDRHESPESDGLDPLELGGSFAFAGALLSVLGFFTVLFVGLPALALPAC